MWEEHPENQKKQARLTGIIILLLLALFLGYAVVHHDWDLFRQTLLIAGALVTAIGILSGAAWLLVRILSRRRRDRDQKGHDV
jgi:hypothetical protein